MIEYGDIYYKITMEFGLPEDKVLSEMACKAFELRPDRSGVAYLAGLSKYQAGEPREAMRYLSRACQLGRTNPSATNLLAKLYNDSERPRDALAVYDLYVRAGGREPSLLYQAGELALECDSYPEAVLYFQALQTVVEKDFFIDTKIAWAEAKCGRFKEALELLPGIEEATDGPSQETTLFKAWLLAELGDASWTVELESGIFEQKISGLPIPAFDLFEHIWNHIAESAENPNLKDDFVRLMFETGCVPNGYFYQDFPEYGEDEEPPLQTVFAVQLRQPLDPARPARSAWMLIEGAPYYLAYWYVAAETEESAIQLAVLEQSKCYHLPADPVGVEEIDRKYSPEMILVQGRRFPPQKNEG